MSVRCVRCQEREPKEAWFWEGSKLGYGPFDFICSGCGHEVHLQGGKKHE